MPTMRWPPMIVFKLKAVLETVITDVQGLRVDEGSGDTAEPSSLRSGQLLVARNGQREEPAHVIDESPGMGGERDLDRVGNLTESISFEKLVLAAQVFAKRINRPAKALRYGQTWIHNKFVFLHSQNSTFDFPRTLNNTICVQGR